MEHSEWLVGLNLIIKLKFNVQKRSSSRNFVKLWQKVDDSPVRHKQI